MARSHDWGRKGESLAEGWLARTGWRIRDRNWRFHHKEIDLVAERDGIVAFVEVKARTGSSFGRPLEAVTAAKRRDLAIAARAWIARHGARDQSYRFDAVTIEQEGPSVRVVHVEDAWRL